MYAFTLERPATVQDAAKLAANGSKPLAGGQTLLASMKLRLSSPDKLADLSGIKDMSSIKRDGNSIVIGAMARHADVAVNAEVMAAIPALAHLAGNIGDRQVRAMGTMGGSVANNDPSACYPSAVLALGATIHTTARKIEAKDYFQGMFTTALNDGELITAISFPIPKRAAYMKFKQQASRFAKGLGQLGFAHARLAFKQQWALQFKCQKHCGCQPTMSKIPGFLQRSRQSINGCKKHHLLLIQ